jgi:hypothetical protein
MRRLGASLYFGEKFDGNVNVIFPRDESLLPALWAFCSSPTYEQEVRRLDQKLAVTNATLIKVPFDQAKWISVAAEAGHLPPPTSDSPEQWFFHEAIHRSSAPLQAGVAGLLGYRWPQPATGTAPEESLDPYRDEDGIVALTPRVSDAGATRLRALLGTAFGIDLSTDVLERLLRESDFGGRSLDDWLRDGFFEQHCDLFHQTPFIWHIWDGLKNGFHVLVNYHKLTAPNGEGRRTLEKLIHTTLGRDWIERQRHDEKNGVQGAQEKVVAAEHLRRELTKILEGEPPYDLFIRWKPLHEQPIGWEPDINDGVRLNIRPFMTAKTFNGKSIFRVAPKSMKWGKDRGKEPVRAKEEYPWFWNWDGHTENFMGVGSKPDGNRWNDLHYTREHKEAARLRARGKAS